MKTRKRQRLSGYDYRTSGSYFITITIDSGHIRFGEISDGKLILNKYGLIINKCWTDIPKHYDNIKLDEYIIMPDHFHAIIHIIGDVSVRNGLNGKVRNGLKPFRTAIKIHGLSEVIRAFKTFSSRRINDMLPERDFKWHKSFYDRIIRKFNNEIEGFRLYIKNNPKKSVLNNH
ncbi:MAG: transposase [Candidatus Marinimicrobia bacterium]|nr:transposase [Candidatus Neomarinimicrobiota bacterium]